LREVTGVRIIARKAVHQLTFPAQQREGSPHLCTFEWSRRESEGGQGRGSAVKKREDTHRMAEANKAFSHYRY
jgi:hypothetical protein